MSFAALFMWAVVAAVGVPSAWKNPTAVALVIAQIAAGWWGYYKDDNLPLEIYPFLDVFVLAVIASKCPRSFLDCSPADRAVALMYVMMWPLYVAPIDEYYIWWPLWGGTILQFLFASSESLEVFWKERSFRKGVPPIIDRHLVVIPFVLQRRGADAAVEPPASSDSPGALLVAYEGRGYG